MFDDTKSYGHLLFGLATSATDIKTQKYLIAAFSFYQLTEISNPESTVGDFLEFLIGVGIGKIIWQKPESLF